MTISNGRALKPKDGRLRIAAPGFRLHEPQAAFLRQHALDGPLGSDRMGAKGFGELNGHTVWAGLLMSEADCETLVVRCIG